MADAARTVYAIGAAFVAGLVSSVVLLSTSGRVVWTSAPPVSAASPVRVASAPSVPEPKRADDAADRPRIVELGEDETDEAATDSRRWTIPLAREATSEEARDLVARAERGLRTEIDAGRVAGGLPPLDDPVATGAAREDVPPVVAEPVAPPRPTARLAGSIAEGAAATRASTGPRQSVVVSRTAVDAQRVGRPAIVARPSAAAKVQLARREPEVRAARRRLSYAEPGGVMRWLMEPGGN